MKAIGDFFRELVYSEAVQGGSNFCVQTKALCNPHILMGNQKKKKRLSLDEQIFKSGCLGVRARSILIHHPDFSVVVTLNRTQ